MQDNNKHMHKITDDLFFIIDEKQKSVELTDKGHELISKSVSDPKFLFFLISVLRFLSWKIGNIC